jgi:dipeptidyl aminopeptidase/acylaminoacyl peptidase
MKAWPTALVVVIVLAAWIHAQPPADQAPARVFQDAVTLVDARNDCARAVPLFERVAASGDRALAARALVYAGTCYERLGNEKARQAYQRVIDVYAEQRAAAAQARARLSALDIARRQPARLTLRPLWRERPPNLELYGKPTVDGLVFPMSDEQGRLVLMDASLRRQRSPIALGAASDGLPPCTVQSTVVVSPDASEVGFSCGRDGGGDSQFRVVRTDPAAPRQRRLAVGAFEPIEWSQPGSILVTTRWQPGGAISLGVINLKDGSWRVVTPLDAPVDGASMSPDGGWVAFDGPDAGGRHDVFVVASRGGTPVPVAAGASDDLLPGWSPDGRGVLFVSDRTGSPGLWLQPLTHGRIDGQPQLLSQDLGRVADVWAATRDGAFIYFRQTGLVKVAVVSLDERRLATGAPSTEGTGQLGGTMMPAWSPDGRRLAYHAMLTGSRLVTLGIRDIETSDEKLLRTSLRYPVTPRWSPDGRGVAVKIGDMTGRYGLFLVDPVTGCWSALKLMPASDEETVGGFR